LAIKVYIAIACVDIALSVVDGFLFDISTLIFITPATMIFVSYLGCADVDIAIA